VRGILYKIYSVDILDGEICGGYKDVIGNQNENESY